MEILRNKRMCFRGTPLFPFQPLERKLPFNLHKIFIYCSSLHQLLAPSRPTNEIGSFSPAWKKPFHLPQKISRISNRKFGLIGKGPRPGWPGTLLAFFRSPFFTPFAYQYSTRLSQLSERLAFIRRMHLILAGWCLFSPCKICLVLIFAKKATS